MSFWSIGINHRTARAELRDVVAFTPGRAMEFSELLARNGVAQSVVLSTCNRCEVFFWGPESAAETCMDLFRSEFPGADLGTAIESQPLSGPFQYPRRAGAIARQRHHNAR